MFTRSVAALVGAALVPPRTAADLHGDDRPLALLSIADRDKALIPRLAAGLAGAAPTIVSFVLVLLIAAQLASLLWRVLGASGRRAPALASVPPALSAQTRYAAGTREILESYFEGSPIRDEYLIVDGGELAGTGARSYTATAKS